VTTIQGAFRLGAGPGRRVRAATLKYRPAGGGILVSVSVRGGDHVRFTRLTIRRAAGSGHYRGLASATAMVRRTQRTVHAGRGGWLTAPAA
jgi:hypothetical protein